MSPTTGTAPSAADLTAAVEVNPVTQARVLYSEWIKFWTLRSTLLVLAVTIFGVVGVGMIASSIVNANFAKLDPANFNALEPTFVGVQLAQLTVAVLGVLVITGEYSTGTIRATLAAVPTRLPVLWAKLIVFASVTFVLCLAAAFAGFLGSQALLGTHGASLGAPGQLRAVFGVALFLSAAGLLGVAFGFIVRSTAGGIGTLVGLLLVLPALVQVLPSNWQDSVVPYFPANAGQALYSPRQPGQAMMHPWPGFALFVAYLAIAVLAAAIRLRRRDA